MCFVNIWRGKISPTFSGPDQSKLPKFKEIFTFLARKVKISLNLGHFDWSRPENVGEIFSTHNINKTHLVLPKYQFSAIFRHFWPF